MISKFKIKQIPTFQIPQLAALRITFSQKKREKKESR